MSEPAEERTPQTQPSFSGRPPRPPKITARDLEDQPHDPDKIIYIPDSILVKDLAAKLALKPFKIVADLLELAEFKFPEDSLDFEIAWVIAKKHGYQAVRLT
jgi:translation initiation factor IF-2